VHPRGFAEEDFEGEIDRLVVEMRIFEDEVLFLGGFADDGERRALAAAEFGEGVDAIGGDREDVAFLRFVAPDLEGRHARLVVGNLAEVEFAAAAAVVDEFGKGVGETAGADVVDEGDGVFGAERPAAVDDLLAAAFHLGVVALDGGEIEIFAAGATGDGGGGAAAEADVHGGAAEDDEFVAGADLAFANVFGADVAEAAGEHDGFVVAPQLC